MKYHLIFFLFFFVNSAFAQSDYLSEFGKKWQNAEDYTLEIIDLMPDSLVDFQPTEDTRTFQNQVLHMTRNMTWLGHDFLGNEATFPHQLKDTTYSKTVLRQIAKEGFEYLRESAKMQTTESLETVVEFFAGPMTRRQILTLSNDHLTHHRGQIIVYLRLNGIKPPRYRGW